LVYVTKLDTPMSHSEKCNERKEYDALLIR